MLILTRKIDEEIIINTEIKIKVLTISESQIKLGITAPADISIMRAEIYEKIKETTIEASRQKIKPKFDVNNFKLNKIGKP